MHGDGIKFTSTSSGTGNLTIAGVVGFPTPMDAGFLVGQMFAYSAQTLVGGAPIFRESGLAYMADAVTMVRARVTRKNDGVSSYSSGLLTATDFAGATVTIGCTPIAANVMSVLPTVDGQTAGLNRLITSAGRSVSQSPQGLGSLAVQYVPFNLRTGAPIVSLAVNVTAASSGGGSCRLGIYAMNEKGYIGKLLATTGDLDTGTTGLKVGTLAQPIALPPGDYFTAIVTSGNPPGVTSYTTGGNHVMGSSTMGYSGINPMEFRSETVASPVLPLTASLTTSGTGFGVAHPACVFVGVA